MAMLAYCFIITSVVLCANGLHNDLGRTFESSPPSVRSTLAQVPSYNGSLVYEPKGPITLNSSGNGSSVTIIDFGHNIEGFPTFEVVSTSGDTSSFEISYSESKDALDYYMSDGPIPLSAAMDTYRVNRYNITNASTITNHLIQGAFRYQKLNLSSSGSIELRNIGVTPTISVASLEELPGLFMCSDEDLNRIWQVGARTIQMNEIPKNTVPDFLQVTKEGAYAESLAPQPLAGTVAPLLVDYELDVEVKPVKGGFGISVLCDTLSSCIYMSFDLDSHSVTAYAGSTTVDAPLNTTTLPVNVTLDSWHTVHIKVNGSSIEAAIDSQSVLSLNQDRRLFGSFGVGASFGHAAYFRNLTATSSGNVVYESSLTESSFLEDFLMGGNPLDTIVDGSRRDRIAYTGDLDIASGASFASTFGTNFVDGTLELLGSFQALKGFFIPTAKIQQNPSTEPTDTNTTGLIGYSFNFVTALAQTYVLTGNLTFAEEWAPKIVKMLDWADSQTLQNGLFNITDPSLGLDWNYYDPPQLGAITKFNVVYAYALQQSLLLLQDASIEHSTYEDRLVRLRAAINQQLWNEDLGVYMISDTFPTGFAQDANAIAILSGIAPTNMSATILANLADDLFMPAGPLAFSNSTASAGWARKISPYASSYHLRAAFESSDASSALTLLKSLWAPMADPKHANYTGCFWETLDADGGPGLGISTSLCHAWAAGPTAELSKHVLGVQPSTPGFAQWKIAPQTLGLDWSKGRYPTVRGTFEVEWKFTDGLLSMNIKSPKGTKGTVQLPHPLLTSVQDSVIMVNGVVGNGTEFEVKGGEAFNLTQTRPATNCV